MRHSTAYYVIFTRFIIYFVMAVQTFRCYVSTDVTFQCIDMNRCVL